MQVPLDPYKAYQERFTDLLSADLNEETVEELEQILSNAVAALNMHSEALNLLEEAIEQAEAAGQLWKTYDYWPFVKLVGFDQSDQRRRLAALTHGDELIGLFDKVEHTRRHLLTRQERLERKMLTAWREKHPRFSSMGTIDSEIQSSTLKDAALARR